jgi:hypothetical protein
MPVINIPSNTVDLSVLEGAISDLETAVNTLDIDKLESPIAISDVTDLQDGLDGKSDTSHNHNLADLTEKSYNSLTDKPTLFTGSYADLTSKPTLFTKTINSHSYCVQGEIVVPSGQEGVIPLFYVPVLTGYTSKIISAKYVIGAGTSATATLKKNGTAITAYTGISITTTPGTTTSDESLSNGDSLQLEVTAVSATPTNLTFSIFIETEVTSA